MDYMAHICMIIIWITPHISVWLLTNSNQCECLAISVYVWQSEYVREYVLAYIRSNFFIYSLRKISFFMVSSSDLKYKLMRHMTSNPLLFGIAPWLFFMYFYMKYNYLFFAFSVVHFFSRHFSLYNFLSFWALSTLVDDGYMMDSKAQRVFFEKTPKLCV